MMEKLDAIVRLISEEIAKDLVIRRGKNVSETAIAIEVADVFQNLGDVDPDVFIGKIRKAVDGADVYVTLPYEGEES
jgi:hypothetical protein